MSNEDRMRVLMCTPKYFDVTEEDPDNKHMDPKNRPDRVRALRQHREPMLLYQKLGLELDLLDPQKGLPDMTFAANWFFSFKRNGRKEAILANFKPRRRHGEVIHIRAWLEEEGYTIHTLPRDVFFEGAGDAIPYKDKILLGYGFRTSRNAVEHIEKITQQEVIPLRLRRPGGLKKNLYHFDTTAIILEDVETMLVHRGALASDALRRLKQLRVTIIPASYEDAAHLALNAVVIPRTKLIKPSPEYPDIKIRHLFDYVREHPHVRGVVVTSHLASDALLVAIRQCGYIPITLDLSEFLKSGAGLFCLTKIL